MISRKAIVIAAIGLAGVAIFSVTALASTGAGFMGTPQVRGTLSGAVHINTDRIKFQTKNDGADVVVTEGFTGNIALKAAEGTARQLAHLLKQELNRTIATRLGYLLARRAFRAVSNKMDPRKSNGGVFLGLNGIVIKSHGATDAEGFARAIDIGHEMVQHELLAKVGQTLAKPAESSGTPNAPRSWAS